MLPPSTGASRLDLPLSGVVTPLVRLLATGIGLSFFGLVLPADAADNEGATSRVVNLSVRGPAGAGDDRLIMGFVLAGSGQRSVIVRGVGPGLDAFLSGALKEPELTLFEHPQNSAPNVLAANEAWSEGPDAAALKELTEQYGLLPLAPGSRDTALLHEAGSGLYTAHVASGTGETGIALAEVYDVSTEPTGPEMVNVSARMLTGSGNDVLILGFVIAGTAPVNVLVRAVGPGLEAFGLESSSLLARPRLQVFRAQSGQQTMLVSNEGWTTAGNHEALSAAFDSVGAFRLSPQSHDAALLVTLEPGLYTAVVSGRDGGTGIALAEVYVVSKNDVLPPHVQGLQAIVRPVNGQQVLELRVSATDDRGVTDVAFFERLLPDGQLQTLAGATAEGDGWWSWRSSEPFGAESRTLLARATDAAGNVGTSAAATFTFSAPAPQVKAWWNGAPVPGGLVTVDENGNLGPFGVVAGGGAAGQGGALQIGFPAGGRIVEQDGRQYVEFTEGEVNFGRGGALQLSAPLLRGGNNAQTVRALRAGRTPRGAAAAAPADDGPALLPLEGVTVADLAAAFNLAPDEGLGVELFGVFKLRLVSGTFTERGIEEPVFAVDIDNLPLPALSGAYAELTLDFSDPDEVKLPFYGEFTLPEAKGPGATVRVPRRRPLILTLRADGSMALEGRAEVIVPGGGRFSAEVSLDDPNYAFGLAAAGVEIPFLDSFAELLPDNAPGLVPPTTDDAQLDFATDALESYARAFHDFSATAAAAAPVPADLDEGGDRPPADVGGALARLVDAWAFAAASPVVHEVADDAVASVLAQLARTGSGATGLVSSTEHLVAAARLRAVLQDPDFDASLPGARAQLDAAMAELERAVIARSRDPAASASLDNVFEATQLLVEFDAARRLLGLGDLSPRIRSALEDLYRSFLDDFARSLGVTAGQFDPSTNPRINTLNRHLAVERTRRLIDALASLQLLGIADTFSGFGVPGDELLTQLAARGASAVRAEMVAAELADDARTFIDLCADLLDFEAARQTGLLPSTPAAVAALTANGLPDPFDFASLESRYATVHARDLSLQLDAPTLSDAAREVARVNRMVDGIPSSLGAAVPAAQRALERLESALAVAIAGVGALDDPDLLAELIDAGTQQARLTRRLAGAPPPAAPWESARLVTIVNRFVAVAPTEDSGEALYRTARLLLAAADDLALEADDPALTVGERTDRIAARRNNLVEAAKLTQAARGAAAAIWLETEAALAAAGQIGIDALLPGNIEVQKVAGGFAFNRHSGEWRGSLSGNVKLPGLLGGASLTLRQATFTSSGEYEAVASGALNGVPLGSLTGDIDIPARRPLRIKHEIFKPLKIAGSATLSLSNGMFFEGYLDFSDPVYRFGASAGGIRFDLADKLTAYVPTVAITLPFSFNAQNEVVVDPAFQALTKEASTALDDWFRSMGATMEPVAGLLTPPALGTPGTPPAFQEPAFTFEFDGVNAFFNGLARGAALNLDAGYAAVLETVKNDLQRAATEVERSPSILDNVAVYLQTLRRAEEIRRINERLRAGLDELAAGQIAGIDEDDIVDDSRVRFFHEQAQAQVEELFTNPLSTGNPANARRVVALALDSDATTQALGLGDGIFINRLPAFLDTTYGTHLEGLGLNRTTGTVANPAVFDALTQLQLREAIRELVDLQGDIQTGGADVFPASFETAIVTLSLRLRVLAIEEFRVLDEMDWQRSVELLQRINDTSGGLQALGYPIPGDQPRIGGGTGPLSAQIDADQTALLMDRIMVVRDIEVGIRTQHRHEPDFPATEYTLLFEFLAELRRVSNREFPEVLLAATRREIQREIDRHMPLIIDGIGLLPSDGIPDSRRILGDLLRAADAAATFSFTDQLDQIGKVAIPNLTVKLTAIAEAQKAWWVLSEYTQLLIEAGERQTTLGNQVLRNAIEGSIAHTLEFARRVSAAIAADAAARINTGVEPFELRLPGDLVVKRVFGDFVFERNIPRFTATFGGELEFPEIDTLFTIDAATIATDGSFALDVRTKGPVDAGADVLKYEMALRVNGSAGGVLQNANGTGLLRVKKAGSAPNSPEDVYNVTVAYSPQAVTPFPVFKLSTSANGIFIFDLDLVAFEASSFLEFTRDARTGRFGLGGTVGTMAKRTNFTRDDVTRADFRLLFEDVDMRFAYRPDGFAVTLREGRVVLDPELFEMRLGALNCDDLDTPAGQPAQRQSPFAALLSPLTLDVSLPPGGGSEFAFKGGAGGTSFAFGNFGFEIPGVPGLLVDVCNVELKIPESGLPLLRDLDARLTIPLEGGSATVPLAAAAAAPKADGTSRLAANVPARVVRSRLAAKDWGLDGFPAGLSVALLDDLPIVDDDAVAITVLGESCEQSPTSLAFEFEQAGDLSITTVAIAAGIRIDVSPDVVFDVELQSGVSVAACGEFALISVLDATTGNIQLSPALALTQVDFCGRFRLGGPNGFEITGPGGPDTNACIQFIGLDHAFAPGPEEQGRAFAISITGRTGFGALGFFTLNNARFVFEGQPLPRFRVDSFHFETGETLNMFQQDLLPLRITEAGLCFVNPDAPLGELFALDNVIFLVSGEVVAGIPGFDDSADGSNASLPRLAAGVECLRVSFPNGLNGPPAFSADGLLFQLENLAIGDLAGITGTLALGGLDDPANLFFAGKAGATYSDVGLTVTVAATLHGPIGLCLDVNAGPAGIPLDGGALGGILLTGAAGGVSFGNTFADPCDFSALLGLRPDGRPPGSPTGDGSAGACDCATATAAATMFAMQTPGETGSSADAALSIPSSLLVGVSWDQLFQRQRVHEAARATGSATGPIATRIVETPAHARHESADAPRPTAAAPAGGIAAAADDPPDLDTRCPTGDCPPPTINLLCQPHPSIDEDPSAANYGRAYADRVIFKFSSLDRDTVDDIVDTIGLNLSGTAATVATEFAFGARGLLETLIPRPCNPAQDNTCTIAAELSAELNTAIDDGLDGFEQSLKDALQPALAAAVGGNRPVIEALYEAAYAGVPCLDITVVLKGTFSHAAVSTVLSLTGGMTSSTTGTAGILGSLNLLGIPVGTGEFYFSATDRNGDPNPSFCGGAFLGIGPLEMGSMDFVFECESCITGILAAFGNFIGGVVNDGSAEVDALLRLWIAQAKGVSVAQINQPLTAYIGTGAANGTRLTDRQQIAVLANMYNLPALAEALGNQAPGAVAQLRERVFALLVDVGLAVNPTLSFCGQIAPKIFGIPLGAEPLGGSLFYGKLEDGGVRFDELAAQIRFSPSWVMLNYGLVLGSGGQIPPFIPGFDTANMGFATRAEAFDADSLRAYLENPILGTADRLQQVVENSILTFGYQLEPFGITLANGQARILQPQVDFHPNNPNRAGGPWQLPPSADFATRRELLFAALDGLKIEDPTWRGRPGQMGELFSDSGLAARMNTKDLVRDYFPHGGIIGASRLFFPKPITDLPPQELLQVFAADRSVEQRWNDLVFTFENYLTATTEVGRLALYFPAPNPPTLLWNDPDNPPNPVSFVDALKQADVGAILASGRNVELYAFDQVFMSGQANARILGIPVADGEIELDGAAGLFRLEASVPPGGWLDQLLGTSASLQFQIANPRYVEDAGPAGGGFLPEAEATLPTPPEVFAAALDNLAGKSGAALDAAFEESLEMVIDTLPRVNLEAGVDFQFPPELGTILRANAGASFQIFGFSPGFQPDYIPNFAGFDPLNPDPYTLARRRGGTGFRGAMEFGFFPAGIVIDVPEASLAFLLGGPDNIIPAMSGLLRVDTFSLPGGYTFDQGLLQFNSQPAVGGDFIHVRGRTTPVDLGPFLQVQPLNAPPSGEPARLAASFRVTNNGTLLPAVGLGIDPARATIPMLGSSLGIDIYGAQDPETGEFTPFTFSSVNGQPWAATLRIAGELQIRDPFNLSGPVLFEVETADGVPFIATMNGVGLETFTLRITMPNGVTFRAFPGQVTQTEWTVGDANASCLLIESTGRIYYDSGTRVVPLAGGAMEVTGRVELGFEPFVFKPQMKSSPGSLGFGNVAASDASSAQTVTVQNSGLGRLTVDVDVTSGNTHFTAQPNRLVLNPQQVGTITVRYTPQTVAAHAGTLTLTSNGGNASIPLSGTGTGTPQYHANPTTVAFGSVNLGQPQQRPLLITNAGTASLVISSSTVTGPYTIAPTTATIQPGSAREFTVTFTPTAAAAQNGEVVFATNTSPANRTVNFTGTGTTPTWHRQRWGGADLHGGHMMTTTIGWAVGDEGTVLRTTDGGRLWEKLGGGGDRWRGIVFDAVAANATSIPAEARGFIVGETARIEATYDGGNTWSPYLMDGLATPANVNWRTAGRRSRGLAALAGVRSGHAYLAVEGIKEQWQIVEVNAAGGVNGIAFLSEVDTDGGSPLTGVAVGDNGTILRSVDGGKTWQLVPVPSGVPTTTRFVAVSASSNPTASSRWFVAIGQPNVVIASQDGSNWTIVPPPSGVVGELTSFAFTGNTVGQVGSSTGQIWRLFPPTGASPPNWTFPEQFRQAQVPLRFVLHNRQHNETGGDTDRIWMVGDEGTIMRRPTTAADVRTTTYSVDTVDFGAMAPGGTQHRSVVVHNNGISTITVTASRTAGDGEFSVTPSSTAIPPGGSAVFTIVAAPVKDGDYAARFTFDDGSAKVDIESFVAGSAERWAPHFAPSNESFVAGAVLGKDQLVLAAERSIWNRKATDTPWEQRLANAAGPLTAMSFATDSHGVAVGGTGGTGTVTNAKSTIYRSTDGGGTWTLTTSPVPTRIADVHYLPVDATNRFAVAITETFDATAGRVILSNTAPTPNTWDVLAASATPLDVNGRAIWSRTDGRFWRAHSSQLDTRSETGGTWTKLFDAAGGKAEFRAIFFLPTDSQRGWVVGDQGNVWTTTTGGATAASWTNRTSAGLGNIRDVLFVSNTLGWIVTETADETRIYQSSNGGTSWLLQHVQPKGPGAPAVRGLMGTSTDVLYAFGTHGGLWRFEKAVARSPGYLHLPARIDLGTVGVGQSRTNDLVAANLGFTPVTILDATIETPASPSPFSAVPGTEPIPVDNKGQVVAAITFRPTEVGEFRAILQISSDADNADAQVEIVGRAVMPPSTIIVDSVPSGASLTIAGATFAAPAVFAVVDTTGTGLNWQRGTTRSVQTAATRAQSGVNYQFSQWSDGGAGNPISVTAGNGLQRYTARYVQTQPTPAAPTSPPVLLPNPCGKSNPPADIEQGPWIKISQAEVRFPTLDGGHRAAVEGSLFLSLTRAQGVLKTSGFRLTSLVPGGGFELLEVTAGSWRFDLVGTDFRFVGNNPGVQLFDRPATPPSTFMFRASWNPATPFAPPLVAGEFSTLGTLPLIPGIAEFGPTTVNFAVSPTVGLGWNGTVSLLRRPDNPSVFFYTNRPFNYVLGNPTPVAGSGTTTLVDFGFARLRGDATSQLVLQQDAAGVFTVGATGLLLDGWGLGSPANRVSATFTSDGTASFSLTPPPTGLQLGALRFKPSTGNKTSSITMNVFRDEYRVIIPPSFVNPVISGFWPDDDYEINGLTIDTIADFELRFGLPGTIGGIDSDKGNTNKNYLIFERKDGLIGFRVRDEQDVVFGDMTLRFKANSAAVSGSFSGTAREPFTDTRLGSISLGYDSSQSSFQFSQRVGFFLGNYRFQFGTGGARICTLICGFDEPLSACDVGICAP